VDVEIAELKREVRRAARGDRDAAASLFDHYHPRVYRYALAKLGRPIDAEDVAAETFARVLADLDRFRWKGGGFEAWLFRIAGNLVVDHVRRSGRERAVEVTDEIEATDAPPEQVVLHREASEELDALLAQLPPDQREVLLLRFAAGLDSEETGRVMNRRANAVRQLQFRALQSVRGRVQPQEEAS
jgi:RNA polymerase sigma-70 factor, ECF subfamily